MSDPQRVQIPIHPQMLQGLLGGPMPAQKPPEVVELKDADGNRIAFNIDALEMVWEDNHQLGQGTSIKLKGYDKLVTIQAGYDDLMEKIGGNPRKLWQEASGS